MLTEYVMSIGKRGVCTCGKCFEASENPQNKQPNGHTVDLTFFKVAQKGGEKDAFLNLVTTEYPQWLDGREHNYIEIGAEIGDQGIALMTIGIGHLLGVWKALSPDTIFPSLDNETKLKLAGSGMVALLFSP